LVQIMGHGPSAEDVFRKYQEKRYFGSLDGIRFISIFMVLWHHGLVWPAIEDPNVLLTRGFTGVNFFFVLSGFLITTLLLREEGLTGRISLSGFYWRRILRIVPAYFLLVTAVSAYYILIKGETQYAGLVPYYYLFLSNFLVGDIPLLSPTWSLAVEEQYYLFWPLMLVAMAGLAAARRIKVLVALIALCVAFDLGLGSALGLPHLETEHAVFRFPGSAYSALLIGSLLAVVLDWKPGYAAAYRIAGGRMAPLAGAAVLLAALAFLPSNLSGLPFFVLHCAMAIFIATVVIREDHVLAPALSWGPVARIGQISYGIYLFHLIALHVATVLMARLDLAPVATNWAVTVLYVPIAIAIAEISFRYYETPIRRLRPPAAGGGRPAESSRS
jgi:peptidoglycan/LPS O-acetylase OafA/YrhL